MLRRGGGMAMGDVSQENMQGCVQICSSVCVCVCVRVRVRVRVCPMNTSQLFCKIVQELYGKSLLLQFLRIIFPLELYLWNKQHKKFIYI